MLRTYYLDICGHPTIQTLVCWLPYKYYQYLSNYPLYVVLVYDESFNIKLKNLELCVFTLWDLYLLHAYAYNLPLIIVILYISMVCWSGNKTYSSLGTIMRIGVFITINLYHYLFLSFNDHTYAFNTNILLCLYWFIHLFVMLLLLSFLFV